MFNKGGKHKQDNEPEEKSENGITADQSSEQQKMAKGKRRRSHSESEVDAQKHKERKRRRTISESSVDSPDTEQHEDLRQKHSDLKRSEGGKSKDDEGRLGGGVTEGKGSRGKKSVQWEEAGQGIGGKSGVTSMLGRKRSHDESTSNEEGVEQKRQRLSEESDSHAKNSAAESGEDETVEGSKKHKKRKRKKKEKKETRLPHLRVISKLV